MWKGDLVSIYIAPNASADMQSVGEIRAVPGKGLEGDRYFRKTGTYSERGGSGREVTFIENEAILALWQEGSIPLAPGASRRNLVTEGVPLNHLVGKTFQVGEIIFRGVRLCEPCGHLAEMTQPAVRTGLVHRGGLRAEILSEGIIRVGDLIEETALEGENMKGSGDQA